MSHALLVQPERGERALHRLEGPACLGGSRADGISLPGLPPAAVRLEPCAAGVVLQPAAIGLQAGGRPVPPGTRRLLRPGERARFRGVGFEVGACPMPEGTRASASALLRDAAAPPPGPPGPYLLVLTGPEAGAQLALGPELVLGRGRGARLRVSDPAASRCHARLRVGPGGASVEDLGAKNRLRVNGVPAERRPVPLRPGDRLTVGGTELSFEDQGRPVARTLHRPAAWRRTPAPRRAGAARRPLLLAGLLALSAALGLISSCG
jgi:hypothetical protein